MCLYINYAIVYLNTFACLSKDLLMLLSSLLNSLAGDFNCLQHMTVKHKYQKQRCRCKYATYHLEVSISSLTILQMLSSLLNPLPPKGAILQDKVEI